jgi:lipopolysaccharide transport system ATP-binding protein
VGDAAFQKKCLGKMGDVATKEGRTVLFVSHNSLAISQLCKYAVYLDNGKVQIFDETQKVLEIYLSQIQSSELEPEKYSTYTENGITLKFKIEILTKQEIPIIKSGDSIKFVVEIHTEFPIKNSVLGIGIDDNRGERVVTFHTRYQSKEIVFINSKGIYNVVWQDVFLASGFYQIVIALYDDEKRIYYWDSARSIHIMPSDYFGTSKLPSKSQGKVLARADWSFYSCNPSTLNN